MYSQVSPEPAESIAQAIAAHVAREGSSYRAWYIGITDDIDRRLFGEHNVPRQNAWYIYRKAHNHAAARAVEQLFLKYGMDGGPGGGSSDSVFVYAYKKTSVTNP